MPLPFLKKTIIVLLLISGLSVHAQNNASNLPYVDNKLIHFGFSVGTGMFDFGVTPSGTKFNDSIYSSAVSNVQPLLSVGIISDLRLARYLNLRFTPTLYFGARELNYTSDGKHYSSLVVSSIPINLPVLLKYSAERKDNYRPYVLMGGGMGIDMGTDKGEPVLLRKINYFAEVGVGCDLYFSFFKLCPELKFSTGLNNVFYPLSERKADGYNPSTKESLYSSVISKLKTRVISLTFNFE